MIKRCRKRVKKNVVLTTPLISSMLIKKPPQTHSQVTHCIET